MTTQLESTRTPDGIVTLRLAQPNRSVVVLDAWLLDQLHLFFDQLDSESPPSGFILMSRNDRVFVAGADLAEIDGLSDEQLHAYLTEGAEAFARISSLDCPSVACVNKTVLGGGLEIAMHCDALIAAAAGPGEKPWKLGLPEAGLGICPGWGGTQMLPARIDALEAIRMTALGQTWSSDALPKGLFERIVASPELLEKAAVEWIRANPKAGDRRRPRCLDDMDPSVMASAIDRARQDLPDTPSVHAVIEAVEVGLREGWTAGIAAERRLLVSLRHTPAARAKLESFLSKK